MAALATFFGSLAMAREPMQPGIAQTVFGQTASGTAVSLYTLTNASGAQVAITTSGARIVAIKVPDRHGTMGDVVLGFDKLDGYLGDNPFFGAAVGRYANRIGGAKFSLDGKAYTLARNNGENSLHGGYSGFDKKLWRAKAVSRKEGQTLEMKYSSADGEEGYPGKLDVTMTYTLTGRNELRIDYRATTDKPTVVNLTNHTYFNLSGEGDILGEQLTLVAHGFTPVDAGLIPTGEIRSVRGTPFDFTTPHAIGERIDSDDAQMKLGHGYDHNWVLDGPSGRLHHAARVSDPKSGRVMEVSTTEPGVQLYTSNMLDMPGAGKGGASYGHHAALCLETQHFPDSPNKPQFPSTVLRPGQHYHSVTVYRFLTQQ